MPLRKPDAKKMLSKFAIEWLRVCDRVVMINQSPLVLIAMLVHGSRVVSVIMIRVLTLRGHEVTVGLTDKALLTLFEVALRV